MNAVIKRRDFGLSDGRWGVDLTSNKLFSRAETPLTRLSCFFSSLGYCSDWPRYIKPDESRRFKASSWINETWNLRNSSSFSIKGWLIRACFKIGKLCRVAWTNDLRKVRQDYISCGKVLWIGYGRRVRLQSCPISRKGEYGGC